MNADHFRTLYDYNYWAHRQVWNCVLTLTDEQFTQPMDYAFGSIGGQIVHTMSAEWMWFSRIRGTSPAAMLSETDFPTRSAIRTKWDSIEADNQAWLKSLTDSMLEGIIEYQNTKGIVFTEPLWLILSHVVNHGTDHRAQTLSMLFQLGAPTVEQDFIRYWREKS